jgi:hypothetical protein
VLLLQDSLDQVQQQQDAAAAAFQEALSEAESAAGSAAAQLRLELDSAGNVRLEEGTPSDTWYQSCADLVKGRLVTGVDLGDMGVIKGLQVSAGGEGGERVLCC